MSTSVNSTSREPAALRMLKWLLLVYFVGLASFAVVFGGRAAHWYLLGGPPLDFALPHNGQVVAHIDFLGRVPPDIARIRISEASSGATVWDVKPTAGRSECWNGCWNLTLKAGSNPASFTAGRQQFSPSVPQGSSFSLTPGTPYLFEVWDSKGRVEHDRFTL